MLEKNIDSFAKILEDWNMKETADTFRAEFLAKPNEEYQLGKYNILKHLQTQLNRCTGEHYDKTFLPTTAKKKRKQNDTFDSLLTKWMKKQKIECTNTPTQSTWGLSQESEIFKHISRTLEKDFEKDRTQNKKQKIEFASTAPQVLSYNDNDYLNNPDDDNNEDNNSAGELPCFGLSSKKSFCEDTTQDKNAENGNDINMKDDNDSWFGDKASPNINGDNINDNLNNSFGAQAPMISNAKSTPPPNQISDKQDIFNTSQSRNTITNNVSINNSYVLINAHSWNPQSQNVSIIQNNTLEEYENDDDPGFDWYECNEEYFKDTCQKLAEQSDFPKRGVYWSKYKNYEQMKIDFPQSKGLDINKNLDKIKLVTTDKSGFKLDKSPNQDNVWSHSKLSKTLNFPKTDENNYYPIWYRESFIDCYKLKFVIDRERTGFEESKDFKIVINNIIAGRYQIWAYWGSAAFSKAVKCLDIKENKWVCLKIIENNKDYFDQSWNEIKVLRLINSNGDGDKLNFLKLYDYFYYKEHLFIVTEWWKDNLYDFYDYLTKNKLGKYFTLPRLQEISRQIFVSWHYLHSLHLIHCDLKPENILIKSINDTWVKVIDFGSSCYVHDSWSSYIQSRSYRAPEVIMGCKYDYKIDIWSIGCIWAELYSGNVLFQSESVQGLWARVIGIIGPIPSWMYEKGKTVKELFSKERLLFMDAPVEGNESSDVKKMHVIIPKRTSLKKRLKCEDENFLEFIKFLLQIDPNNRPSAKDALEHPWLTTCKYENAENEDGKRFGRKDSDLIVKK